MEWCFVMFKYLSIIFICLFACFIYLFKDRASLCGPGCPGALYIEQTGLHLTDSPVSLLPNAGIKGLCHSAQLHPSN